MGQNNFILDLIAGLKKAASTKQIKSDIKQVENQGLKIKITGVLDKVKTCVQLKKDIANIEVPVKLTGKLDKSKTNAQLKQDSASLKGTVELTGKVNKKGITTSVQQTTEQAQSQVDKTPIQVGFNLKKDKLINDIKAFGQQNSKMFKDANVSAKYNTLLDNAKLATSNKELKNLRLQLSAMRSEIKATNLSGATLGDTFKKTFVRATELFTGTGGVMLLTQQMREAWTEALNLDKTYTDLIKVQDELSRGDYPEYLEQCNKKAQELATIQQSLIEGATEFSKSGYDLTTSNKLTEQSTILSNVGEMSASDSAKAIISGVQAYDQVDGYTDAVDKAQALIDKYNEIGNTASITTEEIAKGVQAVGSVFEDANTSVDQFIALLAAGNRQYQNADALALGLRTSALRIRGCTVELEQMGEETDGVYTSASKLQEKIADLTNVDGNGGVRILEADGETFRSIYDIFLDISKVSQKMSDTDLSALKELISGKHRANAISAVLNNMTEAQEIYQRSLESSGSAQEEYNKYLESSEASLNRFKSSMTETYQSVINGNTTKAILDTSNATLQFVNSLGLVESSLKGLIAIGIVKAITTLSTAFKASAIQASNFGTALKTVKNMSTMAKGTEEYANALKTLKTVSVGLSETQLKQVIASKALSESDRIAILRTTGLTKAQAQAKLAQMGLTQSTKAQTTANASATASAFSLSAAVKGFSASLKAAFMNNPVGISIMAISTIIGAVSSKVSEYNENLRETRQANMDAATSAKEKADSLSNLYVQYENLNSITNRTSSQEDQFKQVVTDITKALGDKATALEGLTAGQNNYTQALKEATKAELESQYSTAKIGAKAAEEELKDKTYDFWNGSQITILQNEQMTGVEEHMATLEAVKDILAEYEDLGMVGNETVIEWEPVNWDENKDDMNAVVEYYNALIKAREKLVTSDNADYLMSSDIYEDINNTINDLSESVEKYTEQQYQALKLNYEWQNGVPGTEEEFHKIEESILDASGAGQEFQEVLKGYLAEDYSSFSNVVNNIDEITESTKALNEETSNSFSYDKLGDIPQKLAEIENAYQTAQEALNSYNENGYYSMDVIDSILSLEDEYINTLVDENGQLQINEASMNELASMKIEAAKASIYQEACEELVRIKTLDTSLAAQELALVNGTLTESAYETAKALYEEVSAMGGANAALGQNVWETTTKKIRLLDNQLSSLNNKQYSVGVSVKNKSSSSSSKDAWKEEFQAQYDLLKHNLEMQYITEEQYYSALNALNEKYFANNEKYTDEYRKYQEEIYKGLQKVYKDYIENNMSYLEKALDANKISFGHYSNAVKKMLDDMWQEGKISAEQYWSYTQTMLEKQLDIYDSVISAVTTLLDNEIDKLQDSIDAIEEQNDALEEQQEKMESAINAVVTYYDSLIDKENDSIKALEDKNDSIQSQIDKYDSLISVADRLYEDEQNALKEQQNAIQDSIDAINDENSALDLQYRKEQAIYNLRKAETQRTKKVFNGTEMVYTTDQSAIRDAQNELQDIKTEELVNQLEKEKDALQESIDALQEYRDALNEIGDSYNRVVDERNVAELLGVDYKDKILGVNIDDWEVLKDRYVSANDEMADNTNLIDSLNQKIDLWEKEKSQWSSLTKAIKDETDTQNAIELFGANWERRINEGRFNEYEQFKNNYLSIQSQINDNTQLINSYNEKINYYNGLKEQWSSITNVYNEEQNRLHASQVLGAKWESDVLSGRLETLTNFKNNYVKLQQDIANAAEASAKAVVEANKSAAASATTTPTTTSGSSGGSSGGTTSTTPAKTETTKKDNYWVYKTLGTYKTSGEASSKVGFLGGDGIISVGGKYLVIKWKKGYSTSSEATSKIGLLGGNGVYKRYAKGGVIGKDDNPLSSIAKLLGEDTMVAVKEGERVLTPVQNEMWEKWTNALPNLQNLSNMINVNVPDYSALNNIVVKDRTAQPSFSIGEIHLHEVNNVDSFANAIIRELPSKISQKLGQ